MPTSLDDVFIFPQVAIPISIFSVFPFHLAQYDGKSAFRTGQDKSGHSYLM